MTQTDCEHFTETYPAVAASVPMARAALTDFAVSSGATRDQVESVRLAASEALTNVVMHAYRGGDGPTYVSADVAANEMWVLIGDDGVGLRAGVDSPGLGVGLALIAEACDGLTILKRSSGGTEVRMRFSLDTAQVAGDYSAGSRRSAIRPASPRFSTTT